MSLILDGIKFKKNYGNIFYRFLNQNLIHYDYKYKIGLNEDPYYKLKIGGHDEGGLYFTNIENIIRYASFGIDICIFSIPDDAIVHILDDGLYKSDKIILDKIYDNQNDILKIYKLAINNYRYKYDKYTFNTAANNGYLKVLKWLKKINCPSNKEVYKMAIKNNHFDILKWLRKNNYPWGRFCYEYAVINGNLEILKWLRKNNCPWDRNTCSFAIEYNKFEILKWSKQYNCKL